MSANQVPVKSQKDRSRCTAPASRQAGSQHSILAPEVSALEPSISLLLVSWQSLTSAGGLYSAGGRVACLNVFDVVSVKSTQTKRYRNVSRKELAPNQSGRHSFSGELVL